MIVLVAAEKVEKRPKKVSRNFKGFIQVVTSVGQRVNLGDTHKRSSHWANPSSTEVGKWLQRL